MENNMEKFFGIIVTFFINLIIMGIMLFSGKQIIDLPLSLECFGYMALFAAALIFYPTKIIFNGKNW